MVTSKNSQSDDFDLKKSCAFLGRMIRYGIIEGSRTILFIKAGQDGSVYGYDNKYLKIARKINKKYGCTIICASNPFDGKNNPLDYDMNIVDDYCKKFNDYKVYYMGHSNGGVIGAIWGYQYPQIKGMLLVNPPLFYNWHKIKAGLSAFRGDKCFVIIGELDSSHKYAQMIDLIKNDRVKVDTIKNADHNFTNSISDFMNLPETYLLPSTIFKT